uniref:Uncharacterized protein n=1 Tax=Quercus lobata TaxID=97700 RepID=A0A7N2N0N2_QUELO
MKVRELIDVETRQWDRAKLAYLFEPHTCANILHLPLPNIWSNDVLVWKENKSNSFSVKLAYSIALSILHPSTGKIQKSSAAASNFFMLTRTMMQCLTWDELEQ